MKSSLHALAVRLLLAFGFSALPVFAQPSVTPTTVPLTVNKTTGAITGPVSAATVATANGFAFLSGANVFGAGSSVTFSGTLGGTPTGGALDISALSVTLPAAIRVPSAVGNSGQVLISNGSTWIASGAASGDVTGPASATDNAIARFDATTGKLLQNSAATLSDAGDLSATGAIIAGAATTSAPSFRAPHGTAPTSPTNGDLWTTTSGLFARINGATVGPYGTGNITTTTVDGYFADPSTNASFAASAWRSDLGLVIGTNVAPATSGTSIVYGNGSGGFSNATVGGNLSFTAGTLNLSTTPNIGAASGTSLALTGNASASQFTASAGFQFRGANATAYELLRYTGGTNNPGLYVRATEATSTLRLDVNGAAGPFVLETAIGGTVRTTVSDTGLSVTGNATVSGNVTLTSGLGVISNTANGVGLSIGTDRPFTYNGNGSAQIKASAGLWDTRYGFAGSAGSALGGFGSYGSDDVLTYHYIGSDYSAPMVRFDSTQTRVNATTNATNTTSGALRIGSNVGLSGTAGGPSYFGGAVIAGTSGITAINSTGNLVASTLTGTVPAANGGTGLTSFTSGGLLYASSASALASSGALTSNAFLTGGGAGAAPNAVALTGYVKGNGASAPTASATIPAADITSLPVLIGVACSDETTAITAGTAKVTFRAPYAFTLTAVRATLTTASSSGTPTVDINEAGTSLLSTKLTIDANEKTSTTAATAAVISDSAIADDAEITIDIDTAGTGAAGLKVWLIGTR